VINFDFLTFQPKCENYLPDHHGQYGDIEVTIAKVIQKKGYVVRHLHLKVCLCVRERERVISVTSVESVIMVGHVSLTAICLQFNSIQFNSIQFNFINPNGNYKLLSLLRTIEQELKKKPNSID
jgi:hypothetical protein